LPGTEKKSVRARGEKSKGRIMVWGESEEREDFENSAFIVFTIEI
jgi:hypothetical protein